MKKPERILRQTVQKIEGRNVETTAYGGLHYIKGNSLPYFSLTFSQRVVGRRDTESGGCDPALVLGLWPELADLAVLHLSDLNGVPLHAEANSWYYLAGVLGGLGDSFHGGNGSCAKTAEQCWTAWSDHLRVTSLLRPPQALVGAAQAGQPAALFAWHKDFVQAQKPRWKAEADACIAKHSLEVSGDIWPEPASATVIAVLQRAVEAAGT